MKERLEGVDGYLQPDLSLSSLAGLLPSPVLDLDLAPHVQNKEQDASRAPHEPRSVTISDASSAKYVFLFKDCPALLGVSVQELEASKSEKRLVSALPH